MDIIEDMLVQRAIYWPPLPPDENGQKQFDTPLEILVRWEDSNQMFLDREGNQQVSRAVVYVEYDVKELGVLWLSVYTIDDDEGQALASLDSTDDPFAQEKAFEIRRFDKLPTLDGDQFLRTVYL